MTLYDNIGVDSKASQKEIKKAYRDKALETHPDKEGGNEAGFKELSRAYEILSNPMTRKTYDETGEENINTLDRKALKFLTDIFLNLLVQEGVGLLHCDVMEELNIKIATSLETIETNRKKGIKKKEEYIKIAKRIIHKEESNPFSALIACEIKKAEYEIGLAKEDKKVLTLAKKMLKDYDFIFDKQEEPTGGIVFHRVGIQYITGG